MYHSTTMKRDVQMNIRVADEEAAAFKAAAEEAGLSLSDWLRAVALAASGTGVLEKHLRRARRTHAAKKLNELLGDD